MNTESAVRDRYAAGAKAQQPDLCCPVAYEPHYLDAIPAEVIEKDYGCGDPSRFLQRGETVLDLGSGTGKICFIASQVVGPEGTVIGVDMTDDMLEVARRNAPIVAGRVGFANVSFRKGRIQDLALDLDALEAELAGRPIDSAAGYLALEDLVADLSVRKPLIADDSIDAVVSNCVLNLVSTRQRRDLFAEIHRVLRKGGRAVISDIVSDEDVPDALKDDPQLWSGCITGAYREDRFLHAFEEAGFYGIELLKRDPEPWQAVKRIEFRSVTVRAFKGKEGPCFERNQAVIYRGPFHSITDDDGHLMERGKRYAVCDKTYQLYKQPPYREAFEFIDPHIPIPLEQAAAFDCAATRLRHPRETKGANYDTTSAPSTCCDGGGSNGGPCC